MPNSKELFPLIFTGLSSADNKCHGSLKHFNWLVNSAETSLPLEKQTTGFFNPWLFFRFCSQLCSHHTLSLHTIQPNFTAQKTHRRLLEKSYSLLFYCRNLQSFRFEAFHWKPLPLLLSWAKEMLLPRMLKVYIFSFAKSAHYTDTFSANHRQSQYHDYFFF